MDNMDLDQNEFDRIKKKKKIPKVNRSKIIMQSQHAVGVDFKGKGILIHTDRKFDQKYIDVFYVGDIGQTNFECWIQ